MTCDSSSPCSVFGPLACTGQCDRQNDNPAPVECQISARERKEAKRLLAALIPLNEWLPTSTAQQLDCSVFGFDSPEAFYKAICAELVKYAGGRP